MKLTVNEDFDIDVAEYVINVQLYNELQAHGGKYRFNSRDYTLSTMVSKPVAYVKYIPASPIAPPPPPIPPVVLPVAPRIGSDPQPIAPSVLPGIGLEIPGLDALMAVPRTRSAGSLSLSAPSGLSVSPPLLLPAPRAYHTIVTSMLVGRTVHDVMSSIDLIDAYTTLNIMSSVFVFLKEATDRVPGFRHNDLHCGNIKVNGLDISVLDFGLSYTDYVHIYERPEHRVLHDCGNWDCWKFLGEMVLYLLALARKRKRWAVRILQLIREFFDNDAVFVYFTRRRTMMLTETRMIMNATGKPWTMDLDWECNRFYTPVYTRMDGQLLPLPEFKKFNAYYTPKRFRDYFLRNLPPVPVESL